MRYRVRRPGDRRGQRHRRRGLPRPGRTRRCDPGAHAAQPRCRRGGGRGGVRGRRGGRGGARRPGGTRRGRGAGGRGGGAVRRPRCAGQQCRIRRPHAAGRADRRGDDARRWRRSRARSSAWRAPRSRICGAGAMRAWSRCPASWRTRSARTSRCFPPPPRPRRGWRRWCARWRSNWRRQRRDGERGGAGLHPQGFRRPSRDRSGGAGEADASGSRSGGSGCRRRWRRRWRSWPRPRRATSRGRRCTWMAGWWCSPELTNGRAFVGHGASSSTVGWLAPAAPRAHW